MGKGFLLQGGDCAESFGEHDADNIRDFFRVFLQMAVVLTFAGGQPVVKVGRIAGQFAKPRSSDVEKRRATSNFPSYRGDIINDIEFNAESRDPGSRTSDHGVSSVRGNPEPSAGICRRRLCKSGACPPMDAWFPERLHRRRSAIRPWRIASPKPWGSCVPAVSTRTPPISCAPRSSTPATKRLLLGYEQALTRIDSTSGDWYATSGHMLWIGDRTRQHDHAHVSSSAEACNNPIGLKCGPSLEADDLLRLIDILNPENDPGRLTLIARFGADKVGDHLPGLVRAVKAEGRHVVWSCDPMHGNVIKATSGFKTRPFDRILDEVRAFMQVHQAEGTHAGGIHVEMTGKNVTECTGGAHAITDEDLHDRYHTFCDPRLNADQALEMAFLVAEELKKEQGDTIDVADIEAAE